MKRCIKLVSLLSTVVLLGTSLIGCSNAGGGTDDGKLKIGYCINNLNDTFQNEVLSAAEEYVKANDDLEIEVADAQEDVIKQQDAINSLIQRGVDALIVVPVDTSAMDPITKAAQDAGIPICYVNRNPYAGNENDMPDNLYYVGSQEITGGQMQAEYIGDLLKGKGGVGVLMGILSNEGAVKRTEGVEQIIKEKYPDIKILAKETGNWQRDQGMTVTENWLTAYGDKINAILSNNDEMALGAVQALQARDRHDVLVIGLDGITDALDAVENGTMVGTVLQDAKGQGGGAAKLIHSVSKGEKVEKVNWVPFVLITKENLSDYK